MCCVSPKSDAGRPFKSRLGGRGRIGLYRHAGQCFSARRAGSLVMLSRRRRDSMRPERQPSCAPLPVARCMKTNTAIRIAHASTSVRLVAEAFSVMALTMGRPSKIEYLSSDFGKRPYSITGSHNRLERCVARVSANDRI